MRRRVDLGLLVAGCVLAINFLFISGFGVYSISHSYSILKRAIVASYQNVALELVQSIAVGLREASLLPGYNQPAMLSRFGDTIRLEENGDIWVFSDGVVYDKSADLAESERAMLTTWEIFAAQKAIHYEAMLSSIDRGEDGTDWFIWLPAKGREIAAWTNVEIDGETLTVGISVPEKEIFGHVGFDDGYSEAFISLVTVLTIVAILKIGLFVNIHNNIRGTRQLEQLFESPPGFQEDTHKEGA